MGNSQDMAVAVVSARPMVMFEILPERASSGSLAHEDEVREALLRDRFHPPLRIRIKLGLWTCPDRTITRNDEGYFARYVTRTRVVGLKWA